MEKHCLWYVDYDDIFVFVMLIMIYQVWSKNSVWYVLKLKPGKWLALSNSCCASYNSRCAVSYNPRCAVVLQSPLCCWLLSAAVAMIKADPGDAHSDTLAPASLFGPLFPSVERVNK